MSLPEECFTRAWRREWGPLPDKGVRVRITERGDDREDCFQPGEDCYVSLVWLCEDEVCVEVEAYGPVGVMRDRLFACFGDRWREV